MVRSHQAVPVEPDFVAVLKHMNGSCSWRLHVHAPRTTRQRADEAALTGHVTEEVKHLRRARCLQEAGGCSRMDEATGELADAEQDGADREAIEGAVDRHRGAVALAPALRAEEADLVVHARAVGLVGVDADAAARGRAAVRPRRSASSRRRLWSCTGCRSGWRTRVGRSPRGSTRPPTVAAGASRLSQLVQVPPWTLMVREVD
jgi:hypothetical protein